MAQSSLAQSRAGEQSEVQYSTTDMEQMRTQLLALTDTLAKFAPLFPPGHVDLDKLAIANAQIKQMEYPQLNHIRQGTDPSTISTKLQGAQQAIENYLKTKAPASASPGGPKPQLITDPYAWPYVNGFCTTISTALAGLIGGSSGGDTTYGPTPIPVDIVLAADITFFVADSVRELAQDACRQDVLGENGSLGCIPVDIIWVIAKALDESIHFCNDNLTDNVVYTNYTRLDIIHTDLLNADTDIDTNITGLGATLNTDVTNLGTLVNTDVANLTLQLQADYTALAGQVTALAGQVTALAGQLTQGTALLDATLKQIMKENLTPDGQKILNQSILTCTGTNCPNVLATCQASKNCSWNNVGPLP
jgi:hypothetical protein